MSEMATAATDRVLLWLFRRFPARETELKYKQPGGRAAEEYRSESDDTDGFRRHFEGFPDLFTDADVLDLGSGFGGRSVKFVEFGARSVTGVEVTASHVEEGRRFARRRGVEDRVHFAVGTGEAIPCPDGSFDLVTMMDVMEHVVSPPDVIRECDRVLRPGGRLALVFPPYYDLTQGSHLHGYATRVPGLNVVFRTRALRSATRKLIARQGVEFREYFRDIPTDKLWNLNGLTVRGYRRLVEDSPLRPEWTYLMGHLQYRRLRETGTLDGRPAPVSYRVAQAAAQLPLLRELCCSRICAVLRKDPSPALSAAARPGAPYAASQQRRSSPA